MARVATLTVLALIAACAGDDSSETSAASQPTSGSTTPGTVQPPSGYLPSEDLACVYIDNVLAVRIEDTQTSSEVIELTIAALEEIDPDITAVVSSAADVLGVSGSDEEASEAVSALPFAEEDTEEFDSAHNAIDDRLVLLVINTDPMLTARTLRADEGIPAAPIHAVGAVGHYKFAPGTDPNAFAATLSVTNAVPEGPGFGYVAVVDSGVADSGSSPQWLFGAANLEASASDREPTASGPSHGTFVAGLIRQLAPTHAVSLASARPADPTRFVTFPFGDTIDFAVPPSTELHVYEAVQRLLQRHQTLNAPVAALNLSLGTYSCDHLDDGTLSMAEDDTVLVLSAALQQWMGTGSEVMAAAGNENYAYNGEFVKFWPAALQGVNAIGAASLAHDEVVWAREPTGDVEQDVSGLRPWILASAPGVDLLSIGDGGGGVYSWGGSSFATAVASGLSAAGQNLTADYAAVPHLSYVDATGAMVTSP